jgi:anti-sigma factor RsiW
MLTCRDFINFIAEYLANELRQNERGSFEYHLADCPDCLTYLDSYQTTIALSRSAFPDPDAPLPAEVPEELIQAILNVRRQT